MTDITAEKADTIVISAPKGTKARWVRQSQREGKKLGEWVVEKIDSQRPSDVDERRLAEETSPQSGEHD